MKENNRVLLTPDFAFNTSGTVSSSLRAIVGWSYTGSRSQENWYRDTLCKIGDSLSNMLNCSDEIIIDSILRTSDRKYELTLKLHEEWESIKTKSSGL